MKYTQSHFSLFHRLIPWREAGGLEWANTVEQGESSLKTFQASLYSRLVKLNQP